MKVAAKFPDTITASIAKGMLESHDIPAIIDNQAMSALYPTPLSGVWDVRLMVNDDDYDEAVALLKEHGDIDNQG